MQQLAAVLFAVQTEITDGVVRTAWPIQFDDLRSSTTYAVRRPTQF